MDLNTNRLFGGHSLKSGISKAAKNIQKTWRRRRRSLRRSSSVTTDSMQDIITMRLRGSIPNEHSIEESHQLLETLGNVLSLEMWNIILSWLPSRYMFWNPSLLYSSDTHGMLLRTLYSKVDTEPSLIVVRAHNGQIFGAFCSSNWSNRQAGSRNVSYFGTGETFVFRFHPEPEKYEWVGLNQDTSFSPSSNLFMAGSSLCLLIGGGDGFALQLDSDFHRCRTEKCKTFDNEPLCSEQDFQCSAVEVFGFKI